MASKREREVNSELKEEEELRFLSDSKRQRLVEGSSPSPPPVSIANPLSGLANNYADVDEEEVYARRESNTAVGEKVNGDSKRNGHGYDEDVEEEDEEDSDEQLSVGRHSRQVEVRRDCPYLDTVNRQVLDFDFEKFCSLSLSNLNVYACLVCGKYYQRRGKNSHAYILIA